MFKQIRKLTTFVKNKYYLATGSLILLSSGTAFADSNPVPSITTSSGDVVTTAGTNMEEAMKYLSIGLGGLLVLVCLGVIIHRMREDSKERDHGNLIMTYVLCALGMTLGFVLIAIGWKAFNATITAPTS